MRRGLTIALHWSCWVLLLLLLGLGPVPVLAFAFGIAGLKLEGGLRAAHPWMHRAMYAGLGLAALATLSDQMGLGTFGLRLQSLWFALIGAGMLHGIFHLWRHTALGDGAFRRMTPRALHGLF
jgi:hypothetical protein